jgi:hypothetical protein
MEGEMDDLGGTDLARRLADLAKLQKEADERAFQQAGTSSATPIRSLEVLKRKASGDYFVELFGLPCSKLHFCITPDKQVWMQLCAKAGTRFAPTPGLTWTNDTVNTILGHVKAFGVSNSFATMVTEYSWYIENPTISAARTVSYLQYNSNVDRLGYIRNVLNGLTPTGPGWHLGYDAGYIWFSGRFRTFGTWTSMYEGANWTSHIPVNAQTSFRCGGHIHHTGEFIHTSCNGYGTQDHSITSRANWSDTRVFWFRVE